MVVLWGLNAPENSSFSRVYTAPHRAASCRVARNEARGKVRVCYNGERRRIAPRRASLRVSRIRPVNFYREIRGKLVLRFASLRATSWKRVSLIRGWSLRSSNLWLCLRSHSRGTQRILLCSRVRYAFVCTHVCVRLVRPRVSCKICLKIWCF